LNFKYYFDNLSFKDKSLLFLIVPLVLFFINSFIVDYFVQEKIKNQQKHIKSIQQSIKNLKYTKKEYSNIASITFIENSTKHFNINILNIDIEKNIFTIKTTGTYQNSVNLFLFLEKFIWFNAFDIYKNSKNIIMVLTFKVLNIPNKIENTYIKKVPNPFIFTKKYTKIYTKDTNKPTNKFNLSAIMGDLVQINKRWYQIGDIVQDYTIKDIFLNYIVLKNKKKTLNIRMYKNEK
jgi:hypothetical protein